MRTKTLALSALMSALGSASLLAQTNVYSLNAVGYINVTLPPGYSIVTCPLVCSPDNTLNTLLSDTNDAYDGATVYSFVNGSGFGAQEVAAFGSWSGGGTTPINPGQAIFFYNPNPPSMGAAGNMYATFVGTVPQGSVTNTLYPGYNLVGSIVPVSGDLATNSIAGNFGPAGPGGSDEVLIFDPTYNPANGPTYQNGYSAQAQYAFGSWSGGQEPNGDPATTNVAQGFFYLNANTTPVTWVENFTINP